MTVQNPEMVGNQGRPYMEDDEIDLRQYLDILILWWREILLITVIAAVLGAGAVIALEAMSTPSYRASTDVVIARVVSRVTLDESFETQGTEGNDASRRGALVQLARSGSIAEAVIAELEPIMVNAEGEPLAAGELLERVEASAVQGPDNRTVSDLIRITVTWPDPEIAAQVANTWARIYVNQVNTIYGQVPAEVIASVENELTVAETRFEGAQERLEEFVATNQVDRLNRLIEEKQNLITNLQLGKQTAVTTIVEEELNARREVISAYISAQAANRLLTFNKEQQAKRQLLSEYIDAGVTNRLLAFEKDQEVRRTIFERLSSAQLAAADNVFDQQLQSQILRLAALQNEQAHLERYIRTAETLYAQIEAGGDAAVATNNLAILLLKSNIFNVPTMDGAQFAAETTTTVTDANPVESQDPLPTTRLDQNTSSPFLQIDLSTLDDNRTADEQLTDVAGLLSALQQNLAAVNQQVDELSRTMLDGSNFQAVEEFQSGNLAVSADLASVLAVAAGEPDAAEDLAPLSQAIIQRYQDLFQVGGMAAASDELTADGELFAQVQELYPGLFELGSLAQLTEGVEEGNPLAVVSIERAQELLQLQGLEDIPAYSAAAEPLTQAIDKLESEIQSFQAQLEAENSRRLRLEQQRDLSWNTYDTLSKKVIELNLERTAANSEVRLGGLAVPPVNPVEGPSLMMTTALAAVLGFMAAIFFVFLASYLGRKPFLGGRAA